ncbi:uncharacterized protein [Choristoneura fumiferana]|uniref:uncharacterized protein n=1 Tax=Choristoneura fumiferana TaxID=7141 RepID=UPI003D15C337
MSLGWGSLPLLPLGCVLEHLSLEDALAATSVSRHWRNSLLMYEGRRHTLKLYAKHYDKSFFLARIFKKHVQALHISVAECSQAELNNFMHRVMPQFFDTLRLLEITFIGPGCIQGTAHANVKLDRIITESLVFRHSHSIRKFAVMNCEMDTVHEKKKDKYIHDNVEYYSRGLRFDSPSVADAVLSRHNAEAMMFSSLQHIIVDYEHITTETLETLSHLSAFSQLSVIVCNKKPALHSVDWRRVACGYPNGLDVAVNLISLPKKKIEEAIENVLVEDLPLTSLKVLFCNALHTHLIKHVVRCYKASLREFVCADAPHEGHMRTPIVNTEYDACHVNPFILLCWQCAQLKRLVIHGYWVWQYDIIGLVRLRASLRQLEISAVCGRRQPPPGPQLARVRAADAGDEVDTHFVKQVNEYTEFKWKPIPWRSLPGALRARASPAQLERYLTQELSRPPGVTLHSQN